MSEVQRFTRTCDCVVPVAHGEYVLYTDYDALTQQLQDTQTWHEVDKGNVRLLLSERDKMTQQLAASQDELVRATAQLMQQEQRIAARDKQLAEAAGLLRDLRTCNANEVWPVCKEVDAFLTTIEQDKAND